MPTPFNRIPGIRLVLPEKELNPKQELYLKQKHISILRLSSALLH